jgi:glucokinase
VSFAGFDIGGTNARFALYDDSFEVIATDRRRIRDSTSPAEVVAAIRELLETHLDDASDPISAVGIGIAGQLADDGDLVVNAPNLQWRNVRFADLVREATGARVGVFNDLSALLWGERHAGAAKGCDDVLAAFVGTGFGGAILAGGQLIDGAGGKAGEIGHCKVVVNGRLCGCGQRGCVEAYVAGVHLERRLEDLGLEPDLGAADEMASRENGPVYEIWREATDFLAITIANAVTLLNPAVLLLGGGVLANLPYYRAETLAKVLPQVLEAARGDLDVRFAELGDDAGVLGAALLAAAR